MKMEFRSRDRISLLIQLAKADVRRRFVRFIFYACSALCACGAFFPGVTSAQGGALAWQQKSFSNSFSRNRTLPKIDHGYLVSFVRSVKGRSFAKTIRLHSLATGQQSDVPFWVDGTSMLWLEDVSLSSDQQQLLVAGSTLTDGDNAPHHFIARSTMSGQIVNVIDTGAFDPAHVCATSDGNIWALGQDWSAASSKSSYALLRKYSGAELSASYLQRASLHVRFVNLSSRLHYAGGPRGRSYLLCGPDSVNAYIGPARVWEDVELGTGTETIWTVQTPPTISLITGIALLKHNQVYGTFISAEPQYTNQKRGLYRLDFNSPNLAKWLPINVSTIGSSGSIRRILGSDSASLVYTRAQATGSDGTPVLFWTKPTQ